MMMKVKLSNLVPVFCVVIILAFLLVTRHRHKAARPKSNLPPPVSHLRLSDEIKPLAQRWLLLDAKVALLQRERAKSKGALPGVDWPELISEGMALLGQSSQVDHHFATDMIRLNGEKDPVTGLPHADFVAQTYGYVDCLGHCTMALSGLITRMHRMEEDRSSQLAKEYRKKAADYVKLKAACLLEGRKLANIRPTEHPVQIIINQPTP